MVSLINIEHLIWGQSLVRIASPITHYVASFLRLLLLSSSWERTWVWGWPVKEWAISDVFFRWWQILEGRFQELQMILWNHFPELEDTLPVCWVHQTHATSYPSPQPSHSTLQMQSHPLHLGSDVGWWMGMWWECSRDWEPWEHAQEPNRPWNTFGMAFLQNWSCLASQILDS